MDKILLRIRLFWSWLEKTGVWIWFFALFFNIWGRFLANYMFDKGIHVDICLSIDLFSKYVHLIFSIIWYFNIALLIHTDRRMANLASWNNFRKTRKIMDSCLDEPQRSPNKSLEQIYDISIQIEKLYDWYYKASAPRHIRKLYKYIKPLYNEVKHEKKLYKQWFEMNKNKMKNG